MKLITIVKLKTHGQTKSLWLKDPGFQVTGGAHLKKLRRAEGGAKIVGVFRVKNHDFTPKNHISSNFSGACAGCAPTGSAPGSQHVVFYIHGAWYLLPNTGHTFAYHRSDELCIWFAPFSGHPFIRDCNISNNGDTWFYLYIPEFPRCLMEVSVPIIYITVCSFTSFLIMVMWVSVSDASTTFVPTEPTN